MTQQAARDPAVRTFEATVESVDGPAVVLDETYFYAESGGQPADRGTLAGHPVVDVHKRDGETVHELESAPDLAAGDTVTGDVDDEFRTYCMRAHTASHALYGAGRRLLDDLGYGGFGIDESKVRVDFSASTTIDDATLVDLERLVNRVVWESRAVSWEEVPVEEAREDERVAFNTKTEEGVMDDASEVRVVTIEGWDWAACGGTHVPNTAEIGPVEVLGRSNPGEGLTRVEFAVGPPAVERRATVKRSAYDAATALDASIDDVGEAARDLRERADDATAEVEALSQELLAYRLGDLDRVERDGATYLVGTVDGFGPNDVDGPLREQVGDGGADVALVAGRDGTTFVAVATDGSVDAGDVVDDLTAEFGGGGGGSPTFAQGGGIDADPEAVVDHLR